MLVSISTCGVHLNSQQTEEKPIIVFDYSHEQDYRYEVVNSTDLYVKGNLTELGYDTVWATGGLNSSILEHATGLIVGSVFYEGEFSQQEVDSIANWYNSGRKFLWVACDSDYDFMTINRNMSLILEAVGSHVYPENCQLHDLVCCTTPDMGYRVYAPIFSNDSYVSEIVEGVERVLMHGPTLLYGSDSTSPGVGINPVALESEPIVNVYPLIFYSQDAMIYGSYSYEVYAHDLGEVGSFVGCTLEINAGTSGRGILMVSGASPYGGYAPMWTESYYGIEMNGYLFVKQAIVFGMRKALEYSYGIPMEISIIVGIGILGILACVVSMRVLKEPKELPSSSTLTL